MRVLLHGGFDGMTRSSRKTRAVSGSSHLLPWLREPFGEPPLFRALLAGLLCQGATRLPFGERAARFGGSELRADGRAPRGLRQPPVARSHHRGSSATDTHSPSARTCASPGARYLGILWRRARSGDGDSSPSTRWPRTRASEERFWYRRPGPQTDW